MKNNKCSLLILKFLTEQTDENYLATIAQINDYLQQYGLDANRETISDCIKELQEVGYDIFCVRSTQNQYYMRERRSVLRKLYYWWMPFNPADLYQRNKVWSLCPNWQTWWVPIRARY